MVAELPPTAIVDRLLALLVALSSISDGDSAARAATGGALGNLGVLAAIIWRVSDDGELLHHVGQNGLSRDVAEVVCRTLVVQQPLALVAEAVRSGNDAQSSGAQLRSRYPLSDLLVRESDAEVPLRAHALLLRSEGVPIGVMGLAMRESEPLLPTRLLEGVRSALALWLARRLQPPSPLPDPAVPMMTLRQQQVLRLVAQGRSNAAIASALGYSEGTVRSDLSSLYRMLGSRSRSQLIDVARRVGLVEEMGRDDPPRPVAPTGV